MSRLFGRVATVTVGGFRFAGPPDGFRLAFRVVKTTKPEPNTAEVKIYNLSDASRAQLQGKGVPVILSAGYASNSAVVFSGDSRTIDHVRDGVDWVTRVRCGDGERAYQWARFAESYGPGTQVADVIRGAARALGINLGNLETELARGAFRKNLAQFAHGYTAHGKAAKELDCLLRSVGLAWSIQDGALQILRGGTPAPGRAVLLTSETGLVGSPEHNAPDKKGTPPLLKFKSLLQPQIRCGGTIDIQSLHVRGQFRVESVEHTGDTASQEWYTSGECQAL